MNLFESELNLMPNFIALFFEEAGSVDLYDFISSSS